MMNELALQQHYPADDLEDYSTNSDSDHNCRFCSESNVATEGQNSIQPCLCPGLVHEKCLKESIITKSNDTTLVTGCETCKEKYKMTIVINQQIRWSNFSSAESVYV
eukprot:CAMPEP_0176450880 /NCGR_PEP_ID=MMETSP0127-20121128/27448_1 /TAXON_ID=938130 /ORGANISM="Platyophrya macrostoma, Strain WH" /LENGTH=106 /DNA_ID=CAMNT_0017838717 /DNA_START=61 /DNA_END=377 /DNA_ORIENTATION=-